MTDQEKQAAAEAHQRLQMERLRDEFAMAALSGGLAGAMACGRFISPNDPTIFAKTSYIFADAMLAARQEQPK